MIPKRYIIASQRQRLVHKAEKQIALENIFEIGSHFDRIGLQLLK